VLYGTPACSSENRHWRSVGVGQWIEGPARPRILVHSQHISPQQNAAALTFCRLSYQSESIFPPSLFARLQLSFLNPLVAGAVWRIAHCCSYLIWESFCLWSFSSRSTWPRLSPARCPFAYPCFASSRFCIRRGSGVGVHYCSDASA
jgi:hypothetical protein